MSNNWYVITGGPCCGKTTTVNMLSTRGYATTIEGARHYLDTQRTNGFSIEHVRQDQREFQLAVLKLQIEQEKHLSAEEIVFLDRALPDARAYYRFLHLNEDQLLKDALATASYKKVFILDNLPLVHDYARRENQAAQAQLHDIITSVYYELGFPIVSVPVMFPEGRVEYILGRLD